MRKSFEVALHAGAAAALLIGQRRLIAEELRQFDLRRAAVILCSFIPPAVVGLRLRAPDRAQLGGPRATAAGLLAGALAMVAADTRPQERGRGEATAVDGLALGFAQAAALAPGRLAQRRHPRRRALARASRASRPTCSRARWRCRSSSARACSRGSGWAGRGVDRPLRRALALGVGASFVSTLASQRLIDLVERDRALWPYAAYRVALAGITLGAVARRSDRRVVLNRPSDPLRQGRLSR